MIKKYFFHMLFLLVTMTSWVFVINQLNLGVDGKINYESPALSHADTNNYDQEIIISKHPKNEFEYDRNMTREIGNKINSEKSKNSPESLEILKKQTQVPDDQIDKIIANMKYVDADIKESEKDSQKTSLDQKGKVSLQVDSNKEKVENLKHQITNLNKKLKEAKSTKTSNASINSKTSKSKHLQLLNDQSKVIKGSQNKINNINYYSGVQFVKTKQKDTHQGQVDQLISKTNSSAHTKNLIAESSEKSNQVRSIELKEGESIWMLAKRAYGDSKHYIKIIEANPQITIKNAKRLKSGAFILIPN